MWERVSVYAFNENLFRHFFLIFFSCISCMYDEHWNAHLPLTATNWIAKERGSVSCITIYTVKSETKVECRREANKLQLKIEYDVRSIFSWLIHKLWMFIRHLLQLDTQQTHRNPHMFSLICSYFHSSPLSLFHMKRQRKRTSEWVRACERGWIRLLRQRIGIGSL